MLRKIVKFSRKSGIPQIAGKVHSSPAKAGSRLEPSCMREKSIVYKYKPLILCFLSGFILALPFYNAKFWIISWFGFLPLFIALKNKSRFLSFFLSYFTGIIFWSATIYWLIHVTLMGTIVLIFYLAFYFSLFGLLFSTMNYELSTMNLLFVPSIWVLLEYLRSQLFTGFGWALLGYSQYLNLPIIQMADITGVWGVSFLVMMVNIAIYSFCAMRHAPCARKQKYLLPILCIFITLSYGYYKILRTTHKSETQRSLPEGDAQRLPVPARPAGGRQAGTTLRISVVQGNIPQELKWNKQAQGLIINKYLSLTTQVVKDNPDLIIWPEAALPCVLEEEPVYYEKVSSLIKQVHIPLVLGAATSRNNLYYNSALLISKDGETLSQYDKLHLVPFGEYIPLRKTLSFLETIVPIGDFTSGKEYALFQIQNPKSKIQNNFAVLICFEDIFPELSREFRKRGADFLVNITNDAWFKRTSAPYQHLCASVFRAVENRVFLVRAANTGISGFIAPSGKIISLVQDEKGRNIFVSGYGTQDIAVSVSKTALSFYTKYGDIFILFCFIFVLFSVIYFV